MTRANVAYLFESIFALIVAILFTVQYRRLLSERFSLEVDLGYQVEKECL
jgi:hypothetical protein